MVVGRDGSGGPVGILGPALEPVKVGTRRVGAVLDVRRSIIDLQIGTRFGQVHLAGELRRRVLVQMTTQLGIIRFGAVVIRDVVAVEFERDASPTIIVEAVGPVGLVEPQVRRLHLKGPLQRVAEFAIRSLDDIGV
jgi:hypothetical protein